MPGLPEKSEQIRQAHAGLIHRVVIACQNRGAVPDLDELLVTAENNGWSTLVERIRKILAGRRDESILKGLDEEDATIIHSILLGLQDPNTLPDLNAKSDATMAAPGIAAMVHAARTGNIEVLRLLADMATQMSEAGGDMSRIAAIMRPLISGERDMNRLCKGMSKEGESLVQTILNELAKLELH